MSLIRDTVDKKTCMNIAETTENILESIARRLEWGYLFVASKVGGHVEMASNRSSCQIPLV